MKAFLLVLVIAGIIGGFVGGEISDKAFSPIGGIVGIIGIGIIIIGVGAILSTHERANKKTGLPPEIRGVFDRMTGDTKPAKFGLDKKTIRQKKEVEFKFSDEPPSQYLQSIFAKAAKRPLDDLTYRLVIASPERCFIFDVGLSMIDSVFTSCEEGGVQSARSKAKLILRYAVRSNSVDDDSLIVAALKASLRPAQPGFIEISQAGALDAFHPCEVTNVTLRG
jgi:hypothetical protein